jgi:putative transposase
MEKFHTRTVKLQLNVIDEDKTASWKRIRQISNDVWKAANWIASGQYLNDQLIRRIYARRKVDAKFDKAVVEQIEKDFETFFGTKRQATTERDIKEAFPDLPSCVTNPLNQIVVASYKKEKREMLAGNRSLRTYRRATPIQTTRAAVEFYNGEEDGRHLVRWKLGRTEAINFGIYYGRDKANHRLTVERILEGHLDYSAPSIQLKDRSLFLLLPVKEPEQSPDLNPQLSLGVDLGIAIPAYIALSEGPARRAIGDINEFLRVRIQMQKRRRSLQRTVAKAHGGKGRERKVKALDDLQRRRRISSEATTTS